MKYLVTGATGFIGSRLCMSLKQNHEVVRVDKDYFQSDIPNDVDIIINLGGLTIRKCDVRNTERFLYANVVFTHEILEVAREQKKLKKFIHISTGEVYGPVRNGRLHAESDSLHPVDAYTESKASADMLCLGRAEAFRLPVVIARPCDVYGRGMAPNSFMPVVAESLVRHDTVKIYGDGKQKRQWLHVDDCVSALEFLVENGEVGEIYNVPGAEQIENLQVIYKLESLLGAGIHEYRPSPPERGPDHEWGISGEKISKLGWFPSVSLGEGLKDFAPALVRA